jgi:DNA-binding PadR family transcriptional regulator
MRTDVAPGHIDLLLLAALAAGPAHGYAVITSLKDRTDGAFTFPEGTVYPALHRLEASGLIASSREIVSGRQRRIYTLTTAGRRAMRKKREDWEQTVRHTHAILAVAR